MKKSQPMYLYVLVGLFVLLVGAFLVATVVNAPISYTDERLVLVEDWLTYSTQSTGEGIELIYHYSETCSFCEQIRNDILGFAIENEMDIPVYVVDVNSQAVNQTSMFSPAPITGTPTVSIFVNGLLVNQVVGVTPILTLIDQVNAGTFTP